MGSFNAMNSRHYKTDIELKSRAPSENSVSSHRRCLQGAGWPINFITDPSFVAVLSYQTDASNESFATGAVTKDLIGSSSAASFQI